MAWVKNCKRFTTAKINIEMSWLWDGGIDLRLGDRMRIFARTNPMPSRSAIHDLIFLIVVFSVSSCAGAQSRRDSTQACTSDVKRFCRNVRPGGGRYVECLNRHRDQLTAECRDEIDARLGNTSDSQTQTQNSPAAAPTGAALPARTVTTFLEKGGRLDWAPNQRIVFDRKGDDGYYDVWIINPDGSDEKCLSCGIRALAGERHIGNPAWHPSGQYIVFQAAPSNISAPIPAKVLNRVTMPGAGYGNDIWIMDSEGRQAWQLTKSEANKGVLHPHFSHKGDLLLWTSRLGRGGRFGAWELKLAKFSSESGTPKLSDIQTLRPGKRPEFFESHGFTKDDRRIIFTANSEPNQDGLTNDIYTYELATGQLTNLTHSADYDEHAQLTPSGNQIIWMSSRDLPPIQDPFDIHADYWIMNVDGSNPRRVSRFAERGRPDYVGPKVIAADSAWSPDGKRLAAYLILESRSQDGKIVFLDFDSPQ